METRLLVILTAAVVVSGCAHTQLDSNGNSGKEGQGLQVSEFGIADAQLVTGQESVIRLRLKNYHSEDLNIEDISIYNTGFLEVDGKECSPESINPYRKGYAPEMQCNWDVSAPEELEGFESKAVTLQLNLEYSSSLRNGDSPLKIQFKPLGEIENREEATRSFSNEEVQVTVSYERPVPVEGGIVEFTVRPVGKGRVTGNYTMDYRPSDVFQGCQENVLNERGQPESFHCEISSSSSAERNLVFSTSYKYVKSPSLDIEVVKP